MIGVWCVAVWERMGKPERVNLIEFGPGKATLMKDMLRTFKKFPLFEKSITVHLIEISNSMKSIQMKNLSKVHGTVDGQNIVELNEEMQDMIKLSNGVTVRWSKFLQQVPRDMPLICIGQEFLDAFPVHQFVYTGGASIVFRYFVF